MHIKQTRKNKRDSAKPRNIWRR